MPFFNPESKIEVYTCFGESASLLFFQSQIEKSKTDAYLFRGWRLVTFLIPTESPEPQSLPLHMPLPTPVWKRLAELLGMTAVRDDATWLDVPLSVRLLSGIALAVILLSGLRMGLGVLRKHFLTHQEAFLIKEAANLVHRAANPVRTSARRPHESFAVACWLLPWVAPENSIGQTRYVIPVIQTTLAVRLVGCATGITYLCTGGISCWSPSEPAATGAVTVLILGAGRFRLVHGGSVDRESVLANA